MKIKPLIMIANDDGYRAQGFYKLIKLMRNFGEVIAVSTEKPMSGQSHSITNHEPLRVYLADEAEDYKLYVCTGRPVDCVKIAYRFTDGRVPDLMVSGINHGSNASVNVIYSGTMGAAIEACMDGIPAIGFSLLDYSSKADFSHVDKYINVLTKKVLEKGLPEGVCLNVNIPKISEEPIKGIRLCRQAKGRWDQYFERRVDPFGRDYYWLTGEFIEEETAEDTDIYALKNNYVSVVPIMYDMSSYETIDTLKKWEF
ncbi:MAG: 5'/3'-nucleotidase SurE [Lentimicrobiaceae bacterium]|nr:5'/3'-nucleotidase SurE [Lentimicrobiaceae bacterium]